MISLGSTYFGDIAGAEVVYIPLPPPPPAAYASLLVSDLRVGGDAGPSPARLVDGVTWITTKADGTPKLFIEQTPDYVQFTLRDEDGAPIDQAAFTELRASLRDQRGLVINGRSARDVLNINGGAWVSPGTFRLSLSSSDLVARGAQEYQVRELTIEGTHSGGTRWYWVWFFTLRNLATL